MKRLTAANLESNKGSAFRTTHWSVVLAAGHLDSPDAHAALTELCQTYWYPLYCCVRRHGYSPENAQDLTQSFFVKLLEKKQIALADPERGRFRTFLLHSLENFLRSSYRESTTLKRGGNLDIISWDAQTAEERYAAEPADGSSPERCYNKQWAGALLEQVLGTLRRDFSRGGRVELFESLEPHLWRDDTAIPHVQIARMVGLTEGAVRVTLHRLRQRFHDLLREEIAKTVETSGGIEEELQHLREVFSA
jgi:RNA polymerase sigma factor (sigma-70 family)